MKPPALIAFVLVVVLIGACRTQRIAPRVATVTLDSVASLVMKGPYTIKEGDELQIRNLNWSSDLFPDPNRTTGTAGEGFKVFVRPDGSIILPEMGRLVVKDLSRQQVADTLSIIYKDVVLNPLFEVEILNLRVKVLGSVNNQGIVVLEKEFSSLGEVLSKSGGIKYTEASNVIQIIRGEGTQQQVIEYDFQDLGDPLIMNQNIYDNDIVYVPPSRNSIRGVRFQRAMVFAQPVLTALNLTLIILNFIYR